MREHRVFFGATAAVMLHIADDNFFQPADGVSPADHLVSGLVPLGALALGAWAYPRVRDGARAVIAFAIALTGLVVGLIESGSHVVQGGGPRGDDFTFGRVGPRPQMTLMLCFAGGHGKGFPYAQMLGIEFDDEDAGFRLEFPGQVVEIRGRNLKRLLRYVCDHRAARIDESTPQQSLAATAAAEIVDSITIRRPVATARH